MEPVTTSVAVGSVGGGASAGASTSAAGGVSAATTARQADSIRRIATAFIKTAEMKAVSESEIVDEFAAPIYAGLSAVPTGPSPSIPGTSTANPGGIIPSIIGPEGGPIPTPPIPGTPTSNPGGTTPTVVGPEHGTPHIPQVPRSPTSYPSEATPIVTGPDSDPLARPEIEHRTLKPDVCDLPQVSSNAGLDALHVEKPEIKELINRYYAAPTIKEQLEAGSDKIVVDRNVVDEQVVVNGDKRSALCVIEERVIDRKYLEHGNLTDLISEVRHGNVPTIRQLYLAVIDLADLATLKVFRPLLSRVKIEQATYRLRQLSADFDRKKLEPTLTREVKNAQVVDRNVLKRAPFKTDHVQEKIAHKDIETLKQLEIVDTTVTNLCTVELSKASIDGFLSRRDELACVFKDAGQVARIEKMLPPEAIAVINRSAMAWVRESVLTTTTEYSTVETFHRYGVDFDGFLGKKIESTDKVVTKEVKNTISEYLSPSDKICLEDVKTCDQAYEKFASLQQTARMEFDPQVVESYIQPSEGVVFDEGWITYIPGGSIANLGFKSDLGCDLSGWDYFWAAVDVATITLAVVTCGTSSAVTAPIALGARTAAKVGAKGVAKVVGRSAAKTMIKGGAQTAAKQSGKIVLKDAGAKFGAKAVQTGTGKAAAGKALVSASAKNAPETVVKETAKVGSNGVSKTAVEKGTTTAADTVAKQSGRVKVSNSGKAGTKAKPSVDVSSPDVTYKNVPRNKGEWTGTPGDSTWKPDPQTSPANPKANPKGKTNAQILDENNMKDGIKFEKGYPDFSNAAQEKVKVANMTTNRAKNMAQADSQLAAKVRAGKASPEIAEKLKQAGVDPKKATKGDISRLRKSEGLTWHEHQDKHTMQLIPKELHGTIPHKGGISALKQEGQLATKSSTSTASGTANAATASSEGASSSTVNSSASSTTKS